MSLQACVLIVIILIVRSFLKRYPKIYSYCLWILVGIRLLCPIFVETSFSLQPEVEVLNSHVAKPQQVVSNNISKEILPSQELPKKPQETVMPVIQKNTQLDSPKNIESLKITGIQLLTSIYLIGTGIVFCIYLVQYLLIKRRIFTAVREKGKVWLCENIRSPFVLGVFFPRIFLPYGLSEQEKSHILKHEKTHIKHHDPFIRLVGILCICLHWWNPFVWLAVYKMNQDMEMFCDETTLLYAAAEEKKSYAKTLLSFAEKQSGFTVGLAFGESNTERRVKNIMYKRKSSIIILCFIIVLVAFCTLAFMTVPKDSKQSNTEGLLENNQKDNIENDTIDLNEKDNKTDNKQIVLTEEDIEYLKIVSLGIPNFSNEQEMDINFWEEYLFASYTNNTDKEIISQYSKQYNENIPYIKISYDEVNQRVKQIFGKTLDEYLINPEDLGKDKDSVQYKDGYCYISISDSPDYYFESVTTNIIDGKTEVTMQKNCEDFPIGRIKLTLLPSENERGFILTQKEEIWFESGSVIRGKDFIYGNWTITRYMTPGIYALSQEEIQRLIGTTIEYTNNSMQSGADQKKYSVKQYHKELVTAREFDESFKLSIGEDLGIAAIGFDYYELEIMEDISFNPFGKFFYQIDAENALIYYEGVFFWAQKEDTSKQDIQLMKAAYISALEGIYFDNVYPDGTSCNFVEDYDKTKNRFAVYDIDFDGKDELIIEYTSSYNAGMGTIIYDFDPQTNTFEQELVEYPALSFYDNGVVEAAASHNHGMAATYDDFWPYHLYQYKPELDKYILIAMVDAWDKEYAKKDSDGNLFPQEVDVDGDGIVYYVMTDGEYKLEKPIDADEYNQWKNSYIGSANEINIPYKYLTEENIYSIQ